MKRSGYSLIEVFGALALVMVLVILTLPSIKEFSAGSTRSAADRNVSALNSAIGQYETMTGDLLAKIPQPPADQDWSNWESMPLEDLPESMAWDALQGAGDNPLIAAWQEPVFDDEGPRAVWTNPTYTAPLGTSGSGGGGLSGVRGLSGPSASGVASGDGGRFEVIEDGPRPGIVGFTGGGSTVTDGTVPTTNTTSPGGTTGPGTTVPSNADTDGDGMPDWWEKLYGFDPNNPNDRNQDADGDGLTNFQEYQRGTNPRNPDTDGDGMPDGWEVNNGFNPLNPNDAGQDADNDGTTNLGEYQAGTNPRDPGSNPNTGDSDGDGMPDWWEIINGLNPNDPSDANADPDNDGLTNLDEYLVGTDPNNPDTDGDGIKDGDDPDSGGTPNVGNGDTDGDGMPDWWEIINGLDPLDPNDATQDKDNDGLSNLGEFLNGTDPNNPDTDGDGMPDGWEVNNGLNPLNPGDANQDADGDGRTNGQEYVDGTNPRDPSDNVGGTFPDSDGDGMPDWWEIIHGLNPFDPTDANRDADGDGLTNLEEFRNGTNPNNPDTDGDGMPDGWEVFYGFDPLSPEDANQDADGDGKTNLEEFQEGTDPRSGGDGAVNRAPTVTLAVNPATTVVGQAITLVATGSDPDGDTLNYQFFKQGVPSGNPTLQPTTSMTFSQPGTFNVSVEVTDGRGGYNQSSQSVNVVAESTLPQVALSADITAPHRNQKVTYKATMPEGIRTPLTYSFIQDGQLLQRSAENTYVAYYGTLGEKTMTVTVSTMDNLSTTADATVTVVNRAPVVTVRADPGSVPVGGSITYRVSAVDPDGDAVQFRFLSTPPSPADTGGIKASWTSWSEPEAIAIADFFNSGPVTTNQSSKTETYPIAGYPVMAVEAKDEFGAVGSSFADAWVKLKMTLNIAIRVADFRAGALASDIAAGLRTGAAGLNVGLQINGQDAGSIAGVASFNGTTIPTINSATGGFTDYTRVDRQNIVDWSHDAGGTIFYDGRTWLQDTGFLQVSFDLLEGDTWNLNALGYNNYSLNSLVTDKDDTNAFRDLHAGMVGWGNNTIQYQGVAASGGSSYGASVGLADQTASRAAYLAQYGVADASQDLYAKAIARTFNQSVTQSSDLWVYLSAISSPLLIDLDGSGSPDLLAGEGWQKGRVASADMSVYREFDMDGQGAALWEWVGPKDGLLVWTKDLQGTPTAANLFGNHTWGKKWNHGFEPLATLDVDGNGSLEGAELTHLGIWQDANSDAKVQAGEIVPASTLVDSIAATFNGDAGSAMIEAGVRLKNGSQVDVWDWWSNGNPTANMEKVSVLDWNNKEPQFLDIQRDFIPSEGGTLTIYRAEGEYFIRMQSPTLDAIVPAQIVDGQLAWGQVSGGLMVQHRLLNMGGMLAGITALNNGDKTAWSAKLVSGSLPGDIAFSGSDLTIDF